MGIDRNGEPIYKAIDLVAKFHGQDAASPMVYKGTRSIVGEFSMATQTTLIPGMMYVGFLNSLTTILMVVLNDTPVIPSIPRF